MKSATRAEFGDFQTPLGLARDVCGLLARLGEVPEVIVEPTAGRGTFLVAAAEAFPKARLRGWDINGDYVREAAAALSSNGASARSDVGVRDFFDHDWAAELASLGGRVLILGNPPWVTNSAVAALNGTNLPAKANFLGLRGIAALTGKSNFDISEWMLIQLLGALRGRDATIAMLCKTATARKLLRFAWQNDGRITNASLHRIDAAAHFGAAVDACLLHVRTGTDGPHEADVFASLAADRPSTRIGLAGVDMVADIRTWRELRHFDGLCPFQWRSGVKHDCAAVMELRPTPSGGVENAAGEPLDIEHDCLFPLLKCTDLAHGRTAPSRLVVVTQRYVGDDTSAIARTAPRTWSYLQTHGTRMLARKSSIYKGRAPFAMFGIGEYAFAPWKVAVSGLHSTARFCLVPPHDGRPMFFDDTCYYIPFEREEDARLVLEILSSEPSRRFLSALLFPEAKRPITVELLQRLHITALAEAAGLGTLWKKFQSASYRESAEVSQMALVMETPGGDVSKPAVKRKSPHKPRVH